MDFTDVYSTCGPEMDKVLRLRGIRQVPPDQARCFLLPASVAQEKGPRFLGPLLAQGKRILVHDPEGYLRPVLRGYQWKSKATTGPLTQVWEAVPTGAIRNNQVRDPGDWQLPMPNKQDKDPWRPKCFVSLEDFDALPLWLLYDKRKVWYRTKVIRKVYRKVDQDPIRWVQVSDKVKIPLVRDPKVVVDTQGGPCYRLHGELETWEDEDFLCGHDVRAAYPEKGGLFLSVAGWPLRYVPISYLFWLTHDRTMPARPQHNQTIDQARVVYERILAPEPEGFDDQGNPVRLIQVWDLRPGHAELRTISVPAGRETYHQVFGVMKHRDQDLLRPWLLRYLASPEGRERLREKGLVMPEVRTLDGRKVPEVAVLEDRENYDFGGNGTWTGRQVLVQSELSRAPVRYDSSLTYSFAGFKLLLESQPEGILAYEEYSSRDTDRFGPWGSSPLAQFLLPSSFHPRSTRQKILLSLQEGQDPEAIDDRSLQGLGPEGIEITWIDQTGYEEPRDWTPPQPPLSEREAIRRSQRILDFLEARVARWSSIFERMPSPELMNERELDELEADWQLDRELVSFRVWEFTKLLEPYLKSPVLAQLFWATVQEFDDLDPCQAGGPLPEDPSVWEFTPEDAQAFWLRYSCNQASDWVPEDEENLVPTELQVDEDWDPDEEEESEDLEEVFA